MSIQMMRRTPKPYPPNKRRAIDDYESQLNLFIKEKGLAGVSAVQINEMIFPVVVLYDTEKNRDRAKAAIRQHFQIDDGAFRKHAEKTLNYVPTATAELRALYAEKPSPKLKAGERDAPREEVFRGNIDPNRSVRTYWDVDTDRLVVQEVYRFGSKN